MRLQLFLDLQRRLLVGGLNDPSPATLPELMQGDTIDVVLQGVEKNAEGSLQYYRAVAIPFETIKCAVTRGPDVPPEDGTIRLRLVDGGPDDVTEAFALGLFKNAALANASVQSINPPPPTPRNLETLLNALPGVHARAGVKVLGNQATNIFLLRWNDPAQKAAFEFSENFLEPSSETRSTVVLLPSGQLQALKVRQLPLAFTDRFALPRAPEVTVKSVRTGNGTRNTIQAVGTPRGAIGQVNFTFASLATRILSVGGLTPTAVAAALNELYSDGVTRFRVTQASSTVLYVEFVGPLELTDFPLLGVEMHDQAPLDTPTARLPLNGASLELAFDGTARLDLTLELEITDTDGEVGTPVQMPVTVRNDVIDAGLALQPDPDWLQPADPEYPPYDPADAAIMVPGAYILTLGGQAEGETSDPTGRIHVVTHNLGTQDLLIELHETGGSRRRMPDERYKITKPNDNQVQIEFPVRSFPEAPKIGQYRLSISAVKPAAMGLPHHFHPITDVIGLKDLLDALNAGTNPLDLWPNIPDSKLPRAIAWKNSDGTYRFTTVPDDLLGGTVARLDDHGRLFASELPLGVPFIGPDGGLYVTLPGVPGVNGQPGIPGGTIEILDPTGHIPGPTLPLDPSTWPGLYPAILAALQSGANLPNTVVFEIKDYTESFPPAFALSNHCPEDTTATSLPASLLPALFDAPLAGEVSGGLPPPATDGYANKRFTVSGSATASATIYREGRSFAHRDVIASNGYHWYKVDASVGTAYPQEYARELFSFYVAPDMLAAGSRFAVDFTLQAALTSPERVRGQYLLTLEIGTPRGVTGTDYGPNLSDVNWYESIVSETLILSNTNVYHHFNYAVLSDAKTGAYTATKDLYATTGLPAHAPASPGFAVRATLTRFDVEDTSPNPTGQITLKMLKARASVVKPTA